MKYPIKFGNIHWGKQIMKKIILLLILLVSVNCTTVKEYSETEDGKKAIETAKQKAMEKETQDKVKELLTKDKSK
jgi:hypothetical protein